MFPGEFYFDINSPSIRLTVAPDIGLTVVSDVHDRAVLGVELAYRVVPGYAAVLTEGYDNLVL